MSRATCKDDGQQHDEDQRADDDSYGIGEPVAFSHKENHADEEQEEKEEENHRLPLL